MFILFNLFNLSHELKHWFLWPTKLTEQIDTWSGYNGFYISYALFLVQLLKEP